MASEKVVDSQEVEAALTNNGEFCQLMEARQLTDRAWALKYYNYIHEYPLIENDGHPSIEGLPMHSSVNEASGETGKEIATKTGPEMLIKHPLQNRWALWYFKNDKTKDWISNLKLVTNFDTVEDFWALYNYVQPASRIAPGCDYSLFKDGIRPMWEDDKNKRGGRWLINLDKRKRHVDLDTFWLETLLCMIGEAFDEQSDEICGAVVNIRNKGDKLAVWTHDASRSEATLKIGRTLKERLNVPRDISIGFQAHTDTMSKAGSTAKNRFTV